MYLTRSQGFTLIEILIAMLLGSGILLAVGSVLAYSRTALNTLEQQQRLDNELNSLALRISKDMRRSGFFEHNATAESKSNFKFFSVKEKIELLGVTRDFSSHVILGNNGACAIFTYDLTMDGCIGKKVGTDCFQTNENKTNYPLGEVFGFRKKNDAIEVTNNTMNSSGVNPFECILPDATLQPGQESCTANVFSASLCNSTLGNWESITDTKLMKINHFSLKRDDNSSEVIGSGNNAIIYPRYLLHIRATLVSNPAVIGEVKQVITLENPLR